MAQQAEELGANAIVCTNSIGPGMLIDTKTAKPKLGIKSGGGGVTGKAIFPIALWCVHQLSETLGIPVVGCGGIFTADDVIQMLMAGASAVQLLHRACAERTYCLQTSYSWLAEVSRREPKVCFS